MNLGKIHGILKEKQDAKEQVVAAQQKLKRGVSYDGQPRLMLEFDDMERLTIETVSQNHMDESVRIPRIPRNAAKDIALWILEMTGDQDCAD